MIKRSFSFGSYVHQVGEKLLEASCRFATSFGWHSVWQRLCIQFSRQY